MALRRDSIGLTDVLFQAVTYMAPGVGLAFSLGIAVPVSGATLPLSVLVALIACSFCAVAIGQLAKHVPSAGGLYTYAAIGIGPKTGFLVGWLYVAFGLFMPGSIFVLGGWFVNGFISREFGIALGWPAWSLLFAGSVFLLTYFDVRMSAKATIVLGAVEIGVFLILGGWMIASESNSLAPFTPQDGVAGWSGICQGAVYAILAFIGFEAATALGEEARNPRRTVPLAVIGSCVLVGLFYVFMTYAWNIGAKLDIVGHNVASANSDWDAFGGEYWGKAGAWILFFALINSIVACGTAVTNNAARVLFAMGRAGSVPRFLSRVHPKYQSPYLSVTATLVFTSAVAFALAAWFGPALGPGTAGLTGFVVEATFFTIIAIVMYMISCIACIAYFSRQGRPSRQVLLHVLAPIAGLIAFVLPLYTQYFDLGALFEGTLFSWAYRDAATGTNAFLSKAIPTTFSTMGALLWVGIGGVLASYLNATRPATLVRATYAFGGEATP